MTNQTWVVIKIQDTEWNLLGEFQAEEGKTIAQMAETHSIDIPIACGAGACFVCAVKVISGKEFLHPTMISEPLVDLEEDQFLTCIWGVKSEFLNDGQSHEIVLKKIL